MGKDDEVVGEVTIHKGTAYPSETPHAGRQKERRVTDSDWDIEDQTGIYQDDVTVELIANVKHTDSNWLHSSKKIKKVAP